MNSQWCRVARPGTAGSLGTRRKTRGYKKGNILEMKLMVLSLVLITINIAFAGWSDPVIIRDIENEAYPEIQARHDSIFVIYEDKFIRSLDAGQTWQDQYAFENTIFFRDSEFQINGDTIVVFNGAAEYQFYFSTDFGETWQGPRLCGYYPSMFYCVSLNYRHNAITMCYSEYISDYLWTISLKNSYDFGITWAEPESIWAETHGLTPKIYYYANEPIILYELEQGYTDSDVFFLHKNIDANWQAFYLFDGSGLTAKHSLALSLNGRIAVVYEDANYITLPPSRVLFRASSDSGLTWNSIVELSEGDHNYYPKIAIASDTVVVIWNTSTQLLCRRSYDLGQTWQTIEVLNPEGVGEGNADIDIDDGKIHMVFTGRDTSAIWYRYWEPDNYIDDTEKPDVISIAKIYPNPFNNQTIISYVLDEPSFVNIQIFDVLGRAIKTLVQSPQPPGKRQATWAPDNRPSGIYFIKIAFGKQSEIKKTLYLK